ncbi:MAG: 2-aminoethylphosphonate--pyruvate transaminase [Gammaproteobacteria bacterium]|nr:2-aminoethylphosphonate--pyruvate transaminase [Gammaproteobacteria bacterium]
MSQLELPDNPYLLLTPGPLSTSKSVRAAMFRDWCTWDKDYNDIVESVRCDLVKLATERDGYTSVLMQGSGTFSVESVIGSAIPADGKLLVLVNGAYGDRIARIASYLRIPTIVHDSGEVAPPDIPRLRRELDIDAEITHVAAVHCETTTGMLNPIEEIGRTVKEYGRIFIVDAMSSFGGIPFSMESSHADFCISSANKCIQGVPGFGFVIATHATMASIQGRARSLSMDLYDQWRCMEDGHGKWRFTSPTHSVRAFRQALNEFAEEGGVAARFARYRNNQRTLVRGMRSLGFRCLLEDRYHSPIITAFLSPTSPRYSFERFYQSLKRKGFVIYPGKVTIVDTFRIGNIGEVNCNDIRRLLSAVEASIDWEQDAVSGANS